MKYWEIVADKLSAARLVMGAIAAPYPRWLAFVISNACTSAMTSFGCDPLSDPMVPW